MHQFVIRCLILIAFVCLPVTGAYADYWGTSLVTGTPQFNPKDDSDIVTVYGTPDGHGVVSEAPWECDGRINCRSTGRLFVPVTEPRGTQFETIWLRANDTASGGYVRAAFYRQNLLGGPPELLGLVSTQDNGHQVVMDVVKATDASGNVGPVVIGPIAIFEATYTYYIEVAIILDELIFDPDAILIGYDVGFDLDPCSSPELPNFDGTSCF